MKKFASRILLVLSIFLAGPNQAAAQNTTDEGARALQAGDFATALMILKPLAEDGNHGALYYLGFMYLQGNGVKKNPERAAELFTNAAEGNYPYPQIRLGRMYEQGQGVNRDLKTAYMWFEITASLTGTKNAGNRIRLARKMTPTQIDEAKRLAKNWFEDRPWFGR